MYLLQHLSFIMVLTFKEYAKLEPRKLKLILHD